MKCVKCGAEFKAGEEFCGECGKARPGSQSKKGGLGIIFVGLGVLLLIIILIVSIAESPTPPPSPEIKLTETTINQITSDFLIGDWSKSDKSFTITFNSDGTLLFTDISTSKSYSGRYTLTDSKILFTFDDGSKDSYTLSYIDPNTFKMGDAVYGRTITEPTINQVTSDYLIGEWSKSDKSFGLMFKSDSTFISIDMGTSKSYSGRYTLTDSKILLTFDDGSKISYTLSYIDPNTFKMGDAVYGRIK